MVIMFGLVVIFALIFLSNLVFTQPFLWVSDGIFALGGWVSGWVSLAIAIVVFSWLFGE